MLAADVTEPCSAISSLASKTIVADEYVSAREVTVQARVVYLRRELQEEGELSYPFINHDMASIEQAARLSEEMAKGPPAAVSDVRQHLLTKRVPARTRMHSSMSATAENAKASSSQVDGYVSEVPAMPRWRVAEPATRR